MLETRIIPCLLLREEALVKTRKFKKYKYIGDPANTVRIFNELEVDELALLDILAWKRNGNINFNMLSMIADEAFMPLSYGGGITDFNDARRIFNIGFEKIIINSYATKNVEFIQKTAEHFGSQSIVGSIDVKKKLFGHYNTVINGGSLKTKLHPVEWAMKMEELGVGELLITSVDKEGTWSGFDYGLIKQITDNVKIPVIANGGAGSVSHIGKVVKESNASAVALGSMVVYQKKGMGVLINFPEREKLQKLLR